MWPKRSIREIFLVKTEQILEKSLCRSNKLLNDN